MIRAELDGEAAPDFLALNIVLELTASTYTVHFDGKVADRGTYTWGEGPAVSPLALLITGVEGPNAGRTIPSIFQLVGDRLRICYGLDGTMPTSFTTTPGAPRYLATYKRKAA